MIADFEFGLPNALANTHREHLENACRTRDNDLSTVSVELTDSDRTQVILAE
jgi:hypothetical protein